MCFIGVIRISKVHRPILSLKFPLDEVGSTDGNMGSSIMLNWCIHVSQTALLTLTLFWQAYIQSSPFKRGLSKFPPVTSSQLSLQMIFLLSIQISSEIHSYNSSLSTKIFFAFMIPLCVVFPFLLLLLSFNKAKKVSFLTF